jgi:hypothetical protein
MSLVLTPKHAKPDPMTVTGTGPVRFFIVYEVAGLGPICPSDYVLKSPFSIIQENWRQALPKMAQKYPGRAESLEIDCHGAPGLLLINPQLNLTSLHGFADALRGLLRPYGLVEFLACRVANYDVSALVQHMRSVGRKADAEFLSAWLRDTGALPQDVYHKEEGRVDPELSAALKKIRNQGYEAAKLHQKCPYPAGTLEANIWQSGADSAAGAGGSRDLVLARKDGTVLAGNPLERSQPSANLDHARVARLAIESGLLEIGDDFNGPLFCSRAARLLRCRVRASMASQPSEQTSGMGLDEFLNTHNYGVMPTGSWTGHIFEFAPSGGVTYLGYDVPRPVYVPITPGGEGSLRQV